ncbi:MAG: PqqD family protein [Balneolaceae bacterium]|nr:PqqD family protein [Balneolaceae bacterium]
MIHNQTRYQRKQHLLAAPIDDELVLLHVDKGQYYNLKGVGPDLWNRLETPHSVDELVEWVCEEYDVAKDVATADVQSFLSELLEVEAIVIAQEA